MDYTQNSVGCLNGETIRDIRTNATQMIDKAFSENPDVLVVLEIAARAREAEARELPREIGISAEVVAIPTDLQCAM